MNKIRRITPSKRIRGISFFTTDDLQKILDLQKRTIRKYLSTGKIKGAIKVGRRFYLSNKNLDHFLEGK